MLLVDQSDSLDESGKAALRDQAATLVSAQPERIKLLYFGADTAAPDEAPARADNSDIAGALLAARELVGGSGGRIVLLSDGAQTRGDALAMAQALGVPVDTLGSLALARPEIWVSAVDMPQTLREGEEYTIEVVASSSDAATARLTLDDGSAQLAAQDVQLTPGENRLTFRARAGQPGILRLRAALDGGPDTFAQNNQVSATALVAPQPRVLLVESQPSAAAQLRAALRPAGVIAEIISANSAADAALGPGGIRGHRAARCASRRYDARPDDRAARVCAQ